MEHVRDNVYVELISPGCNVGVITTDKGTIIVDTPLVSRQARMMDRELLEKGHEPIRILVLTHHHGDHLLGTALFGDDVLIVGNRLTFENMDRHSASWVEAWVKTWDWETPEDIHEMMEAEIHRPEVIFEKELTLNMAGIEIRILPLPGHLAESVGVFVPQAGVLITGDALFNEHHPYMGEGNLQVWLESLDRMENLQVERIIPGHGPVCGLEAIDKQRRYMEKMIELRHRWNPLEGGKSAQQAMIEGLLAFYPLHGRPEELMRARVVESVRVAGDPQF